MQRTIHHLCLKKILKKRGRALLACGPDSQRPWCTDNKPADTGSPSPSSARTSSIDTHQLSKKQIRVLTISDNMSVYTIYDTWTRRVIWYGWIHTMEASERARTDTRAFLMVASWAWSELFELDSLGDLLGTQPFDDCSGLSSPAIEEDFAWWWWWWSKGTMSFLKLKLPTDLFRPFSTEFAENDLSLDEASSLSAATEARPRSMNCLGTMDCFFTSIFRSSILTCRNLQNCNQSVSEKNWTIEARYIYSMDHLVPPLAI